MSTTAATTATTATSKTADFMTKVQKHVDTLHAKINKLAEENAALKAQLHEAKAANSRVRRIPKKPQEATTTA